MVNLMAGPGIQEQVQRLSRLVVIMIGIIAGVAMIVEGVVALAKLVESNFVLDVIAIVLILVLIAASLLPHLVPGDTQEP